jgi:hypothetical protein
MARRGLSSTEAKKKRDALFDKLKKNRSNVTYEQNRKNNTGGGGKTEKPTAKKKLTGKERAQKMARERIAAKKAGTYKKPKTAQELAKARLKIKKKKK